MRPSSSPWFARCPPSSCSGLRRDLPPQPAPLSLAYPAPLSLAYPAPPLPSACAPPSPSPIGSCHASAEPLRDPSSPLLRLPSIRAAPSPLPSSGLIGCNPSWLQPHVPTEGRGSFRPLTPTLHPASCLALQVRLLVIDSIAFHFRHGVARDAAQRLQAANSCRVQRAGHPAPCQPPSPPPSTPPLVPGRRCSVSSPKASPTSPPGNLSQRYSSTRLQSYAVEAATIGSRGCNPLDQQVATIFTKPLALTKPGRRVCCPSLAQARPTRLPHLTTSHRCR